MRLIICGGLCAVALSLGACGTGGSSASDSTGAYLGSYITPNPAGATAECSNFYGPANLKTSMNSAFNRTTPCPTELAIGACEVPTGSGTSAMQVEMVYYEQINNQGKKIAAPFENLNNGDPCNTNGVWRKPYATTPPASVAASGTPAGDGGSGGTGQDAGASASSAECKPYSVTVAGKECLAAEECPKSKCAADYVACFGTGFGPGEHTGALCERALDIYLTCKCDKQCESSSGLSQAFSGGCSSCITKIMGCKCDAEMESCRGN